jgi:predicted HD phosphohydrolase
MTHRLDVARVLSLHGARRYTDTVSQLEHALQCAALARRNRAADEIVLAALLHDFGHLPPARCGDVPLPRGRGGITGTGAN